MGLDPDRGRLLLRVAAAPTDGDANKAVVALLAKAIGVPKSAITLVDGARSRDKRVSIVGKTDPILHALDQYRIRE